MSGERVGTPAIAIMTSGFVSAAQVMAEALGVGGYPFVVIEHPIASAGDAALELRARAALAQARGILGWA